jgi:hypothetical protein
MRQDKEHMYLSDGWSGVIYQEWDFPAEVVETWERLALDYGDAGIFVSYIGGSGTVACLWQRR